MNDSAPSPVPLTAVIICRNEEAVIADAIGSAAFADEVLVLDSGSTDRTTQIAQALGARVEHQEWLGFGRQKNRAVELASHDWVYVLDSDERITAALRGEIEEVMKAPQRAAYHVPRLNRFFGKDIRHGGLYPDYSIRLFDRTKGRFDEAPVHESVQIENDVGYLRNPMRHLAYDSIAEFIDKQNRYASLHQKERNILKAMVNPCWAFFRMYFLRRGFLDGWHGFVIARLYAQYTFWKYAAGQG